jgi:hypothetical protein
MKTHTALVVLLVTGLMAGAAAAKNGGNGQKGSALPESVRKVERETGGDVLRAESRTQNGEEVTRVKVITPQGRVRTVESSRRSQDSQPQQQEQPDPES